MRADKELLYGVAVDATIGDVPAHAALYFVEWAKEFKVSNEFRLKVCANFYGGILSLAEAIVLLAEEEEAYHSKKS